MGIADKVRGGRESVRLDGVDLAGEHARAGSRDGEKGGKREDEAGGQLGSIRQTHRPPSRLPDRTRDAGSTPLTRARQQEWNRSGSKVDRRGWWVVQNRQGQERELTCKRRRPRGIEPAWEREAFPWFGPAGGRNLIAEEKEETVHATIRSGVCEWNEVNEGEGGKEREGEGRLQSVTEERVPEPTEGVRLSLPNNTS